MTAIAGLRHEALRAFGPPRNHMQVQQADGTWLRQPLCGQRGIDGGHARTRYTNTASQVSCQKCLARLRKGPA
jgi:hypothetical protein